MKKNFLIKRTHDILYLSENNYKKPKEIHSYLVKLIKKDLKKIKKNVFEGSIIDVGSANGELLYLLRKNLKNSKLLGLEILKPLVDMSKKKLLNYNIRIKQGSILEKKNLSKINSDITISCGVLPIFDDYKIFIDNLIYITKKGGRIYIASLFNDYPIDVFVKYKLSKNFKKNYLESGWNIFSKKTVLNYLSKKTNIKKYFFSDFSLKKELKFKKNDPVRSWTFKDSKKKLITRNGLSLILPTSVLCIELK
jgi:SAM-dependent methyltransferase